VLDIILDNAIRFKFDPVQHLVLAKTIIADTTLPNPEFVRRQRLGMYLGGTPATLKFRTYDKKTMETVLPRGYWDKLLYLLDRLAIEFDTSDFRVTGTPRAVCDYPGANLSLREYQIPAVAALANNSGGVLVAGCGSGKTVCGLELVQRIHLRALWITHTKDLAEQTVTQAQEKLGLESREIGWLCGGKKPSTGRNFTIALVQSLARNWDNYSEEFGDLGTRFGLVILDECHHCPAVSFQIIGRFSALYRYGLTATPDRADGLGPVVNLYLGPVRYTIPPAAVAAEGGTVVPKLITIKYGGRNTAWDEHAKLRVQYSQGKIKHKPRLDYNRLIDAVIADDKRNAMLVQTIGQTSLGHTSLVLSERVHHCMVLRDRLTINFPGLRCAIIHGNQPQDHRDRALRATRAGEIDVLLAVNIAKEGLDIPRLDRLHLVAGGRNESELKQKIGRIMRPAPGKTNATVYDYVDENVGVLLNQYYARRRVYQALRMLDVTKKAG